MSKRFAGKVTATLLSVVALGSLVSSQSQTEGKCGEPQSYDTENYVVREVAIDAPLGWLFGSVNERLGEILLDPSMPIKKGDVYRKANADAGFIKVRSSFPELTVSPVDRFEVRIAKPGLRNCNAQTKMLDVVYHVYTIGFSYYLSRVFETGGKEEVKRSVVDTPTTESLANYFPQPYAGFNRSRGVFGGTKLSINQPRGLLNKISVQASGSSSSSEATAEATGSKDYGQGFIRHLEYRFRYLYSNLPGDSVKLKQGSGLGQVFAATRAYGSTELVLRFGGLIEGGNKQSDIDPRLVLTADLISSGYSSLKAFVGGSMRVGRHALKGSYGLQLGSTRTGNNLDYVKQVVDAVANLRFPVADHKPITIDLQLTGGRIQTRGRLPVAERFFGGNAEQDFIASDTWTIQSSPFIRSFPQNSFGQANATGVLGGDSFFSTNLTLGVTVWSKPLVPSEISNDDGFQEQVDFALGTAESALQNEYLSSSPEFHQMAELIKPLSRDLGAVTEELTSVENQTSDRKIKDQISLIRNVNLKAANDTADAIKKDLETGAPKTADIRKLVVGFPNNLPPAYVSSVENDVRSLQSMPGLPGNHLGQILDGLEASRDKMAKAFVALNQSSVVKQAELKARRDMKYPTRVVKELTQEANLVAISPIFIFDAARLRQNALPQSDVRYAVGVGLRLNVVSLDVTAGYAFNPNPKPWERRGAFLFTMGVSNLFR